jgi:hypothetical protein
MESAENDSTIFRPSHKTLKIDETDFHIPTATTTTEQSFHLKPEKPVQTNGATATFRDSQIGWRKIRSDSVPEDRTGCEDHGNRHRHSQDLSSHC